MVHTEGGVSSQLPRVSDRGHWAIQTQTHVWDAVVTSCSREATWKFDPSEEVLDSE